MTKPLKIILLGNAGTGKSTMAKGLIEGTDIPRLSLDEIAWDEGPQRKPLAQSIALLMAFIERHPQWILEGCYSDLVEAALPHCTELRFLNPGVEVAVQHCLMRPWEPEKFPTPEAQQAMLDYLVSWVREYATRSDEYGLARHRALFESFSGNKREYSSVSAYTHS